MATHLTGSNARPETDDRVAGLLEIAGALSADLDFETLLKVLAQRTARICGADRCAIYLVQDEALLLAMAHDASGRGDDARWPVPGGTLSPDRVEILPGSSALVLPLQRGPRQVGAIHVSHAEGTRTFDAGDVELGRAVAVQLALVIDNARLVEETRQRLRDTETLLAVGQAINSTLDVMEVVRRIARAAATAVGADSSGVYLTSQRGTLAPLAGYRVPKAFLESARDAEFALDGFRDIGAALREPAETLWSDDVPNDPRFAHEVFRRLPLQSALITCVRAKDELVGILVCTWWERKRRFADQELELVRAMAAQAGVAIMNARLYAEAEQVAVDRERVRVAHELHDRLSQAVFSLGLRLEWCLHHTPARSRVHAKLREVWKDAGAIMNQMRHLIYCLSPETAAASDLEGRLRTLVAEFEELSGISVHYEQRGALTGMDGRHEDVLFKTLQEGLANIVKHARASRVSLTLDVRDGTVSFDLVDDGIGPPAGFPATARANGSHGLRLMADRIEGAGGHVALGATDARGFAVRGTLPLQVVA